VPEKRWHSRSPADTGRIAQALAEAVAEEAVEVVVALSGPLGAGKTAFATALAEALGVPRALLASPSFVLAHEFALAGPRLRRLVHADFYRVEGVGELLAAGLDDWLAPDALLVAEWADRFPGALPADRLDVRLDLGQGPSARELSARASGPASERVLARWRERCP
jgi:tRNA threonylcarbamoyladenosine biosynthesis protein TsaE